MNINEAGLNLIKEFEGLKLEAYPDPASGGEPWTIGYGSTYQVTPGLVISEEQASDRLKNDLVSKEKGVSHLVISEVNDNQFSAMVCFAYNLGLEALQTSTLLKLVNSGNFEAATEEFPKWCKAGGKEMPGLLRRRLAEQALFKA